MGRCAQNDKKIGFKIIQKTIFYFNTNSCLGKRPFGPSDHKLSINFCCAQQIREISEIRSSLFNQSEISGSLQCNLCRLSAQNLLNLQIFVHYKKNGRNLYRKTMRKNQNNLFQDLEIICTDKLEIICPVRAFVGKRISVIIIILAVISIIIMEHCAQQIREISELRSSLFNQSEISCLLQCMISRTDPLDQ